MKISMMLTNIFCYLLSKDVPIGRGALLVT